jgi:threonine dehydrogenase-like Zn-dependent dehydrogenase
MANLAPIPDELTDEQVLMCPDIMSTGFGGAESGRIRIGDTVAVFAQGPIGLCATVGAKLSGATRIFTVDTLPQRLAMSSRLGADVTINRKQQDPVKTILEGTSGRGVDVAIEALGTQETFESCLRVLRPGGVLSSLGVYSGKLSLPLDAFAAGLGDHTVVTTLCPGGQGANAEIDERARVGEGRSPATGDASLSARPDRRGLRAFRESARRGAQSRHHALRSPRVGMSRRERCAPLC